MKSSTLDLDGISARFVDLPAILGENLNQFPWLMRIAIENSIRNGKEEGAICASFVQWLEQGRSTAEIAFHPTRLMMHDTTCVPALVDMAAMRDAVSEMGGDPQALNPLLRVDVSIDHSVAVDAYGAPGVMAFNMTREIERNIERYRLMKWACQSFEHMRVHAPGTGIMHTMNLEQLASVIAHQRVDGQDWFVPDTLIGTDSHTPMVNGIGILAWGVGGLEAESVMFGMPVMLRIPDIIGVRLTGALPSGVLSTDLALRVTERLRQHGLSGEFVEFFGPGVSTLSAGDRAVVANMAPEYGASSGYFPIDERTIAYLAATGRAPADIRRVEAVARRQGLWFDPDVTPVYTETVDIDLTQISTSLAGPRRPQDRLSPSGTRQALEHVYRRPLAPLPDAADIPPDGAVALAAITSCTNTTDPRLTIAAGLLARNARKLGLRPPPWVKTSLAPGSPAAARYLARAGLMDDLSAIGFDIVGFGCTTCIGNSGPLETTMSHAVETGTAAAAVLSGNRNFPGRVHPQIEAGFLASPALVVAYALAGNLRGDIMADPIGRAADGSGIFLRDIWPDSEAIDATTRLATDPADFAAAFAEAENNPAWSALDVPSTTLFGWDERSTYVRRPPFAAPDQPSRLGHYQADILLSVGDDITTDHISPAGQISARSEAGHHLTAYGDDPHDLNVFAARRGNWEVMIRGLFTNRAVHNLLDEALPAGSTIHAPSGDVLPLWQAAERYQQEGRPVVVVAGARYGTGSSRDWAAKGVGLLGVKALLAVSFERIHRSNLIGMGILPLLLPAVMTPETMALRPGDRIEINARPDAIQPRCIVEAAILRRNGTTELFTATAAIETELEIAILRAGGVMPLIIEGAMAASPQ